MASLKHKIDNYVMKKKKKKSLKVSGGITN